MVPMHDAPPVSILAAFHVHLVEPGSAERSPAARADRTGVDPLQHAGRPGSLRRSWDPACRRTLDPGRPTRSYGTAPIWEETSVSIGLGEGRLMALSRRLTFTAVTKVRGSTPSASSSSSWATGSSPETPGTCFPSSWTCEPSPGHPFARLRAAALSARRVRRRRSCSPPWLPSSSSALYASERKTAEPHSAPGWGSS